MKISYRTHPILKMLEEDEPEFQLDNRESDFYVIGREFVQEWKKKRAIFKKDIIIVSEPFADAANACAKKMIDNQLYNELGTSLSGTLIINNMSFCYEAERFETNGQKGWMFDLIIFTHKNALDIIITKSFKYISKAAFTHLQTLDDREVAIVHFEFIQTCLLFKKFAQVETKILAEGQKIKEIDCKYINDTNLNVTFLDSKWFTNLVKSDGFDVRGHFRLQPKKVNGEWTKEIIWINPFHKTGYTAPARKLKEFPV